MRRRSRAKSGDSSALSDAEGTDTAGAEENGPAREFKFPRHKRHTVFPDAGDVDDDVSRQYLRGSRSPPGIANHLLRSSSGGSKVSHLEYDQQWFENLTSSHLRCLTTRSTSGSPAGRAPLKVPPQSSHCRQWPVLMRHRCRRPQSRCQHRGAVQRNDGSEQQCAKTVPKIR